MPKVPDIVGGVFADAVTIASALAGLSIPSGTGIELLNVIAPVAASGVPRGVPESERVSPGGLGVPAPPPLAPQPLAPHSRCSLKTFAGRLASAAGARRDVLICRRTL